MKQAESKSQQAMQLLKIVLTCLGLATLALSAPTDTGNPALSTGSLATLWRDTKTQRYHCVDKDIIRCEMAAGGSCLSINFCQSYCSKHEQGAVCVDTAEVTEGVVIDNGKPTLKAQVPKVDRITARDASPQEDKHYVCSKDRRSVLICRFGFCSTDYYCKSDEECKDRSVSCQSKLSFAEVSKSGMRAMASRSGTAPIKRVTRNRGSKDKSSYVCSKDRASVLKCMYGFCATDYYCAKGHPCVDNPARCKKAN